MAPPSGGITGLLRIGGHKKMRREELQSKTVGRIFGSVLPIKNWSMTGPIVYPEKKKNQMYIILLSRRSLLRPYVLEFLGRVQEISIV